VPGNFKSREILTGLYIEIFDLEVSAEQQEIDIYCFNLLFENLWGNEGRWLIEPWRAQVALN